MKRINYIIFILLLINGSCKYSKEIEPNKMLKIIKTELQKHEAKFDSINDWIENKNYQFTYRLVPYHSEQTYVIRPYDDSRVIEDIEIKKYIYTFCMNIEFSDILVDENHIGYLTYSKNMNKKSYRLLYFRTEKPHIYKGVDVSKRTTIYKVAAVYPVKENWYLVSPVK